MSACVRACVEVFVVSIRESRVKCSLCDVSITLSQQPCSYQHCSLCDELTSDQRTTASYLDSVKSSLSLVLCSRTHTHTHTETHTDTECYYSHFLDCSQWFCTLDIKNPGEQRKRQERNERRATLLCLQF